METHLTSFWSKWKHKSLVKCWSTIALTFKIWTAYILKRLWLPRISTIFILKKAVDEFIFIITSNLYTHILSNAVTLAQ